MQAMHLRSGFSSNSIWKTKPSRSLGILYWIKAAFCVDRNLKNSFRVGIYMTPFDSLLTLGCDLEEWSHLWSRALGFALRGDGPFHWGKFAPPSPSRRKTGI